jgi:hypothetical protein
MRGAHNAHTDFGARISLNCMPINDLHTKSSPKQCCKKNPCLRILGHYELPRRLKWNLAAYELSPIREYPC